MIYTLLKKRRSIRKFQDKAIEKDKVDIILNSALLSPSSRSRRPWEFIIVNNKELLITLSKCKEHGSEFLENAPLGIVIIADPSICDVWIEDTSIASIIIQLAAHSLDLGSCWIQIRERFYSNTITAEEYTKQILNIPGKYRVEAIIAVGYPAEEKKAYDVNELSNNKIHFNKY